MARNPSFDLGLPPFRGAVRQIILASTAIYIVILLLMSFATNSGQALLQFGILNPLLVRQGWFWQFVTYAFMYVDPMDFVLSLLGVYFLGSAVEERIGSVRFYGLFFGLAFGVDISIARELLLVMVAVALSLLQTWIVIELFFLFGTDGPNRFGPDPTRTTAIPPSHSRPEPAGVPDFLVCRTGPLQSR